MANVQTLPVRDDQQIQAMRASNFTEKNIEKKADVGTKNGIGHETEMTDEVIYAQGDMIITVCQHRFRVSAAIMSIASPYCEAKLKWPHHLNSAQAPTMLNPICFEELDTDPESMRILLHTLHFSRFQRFAKLADQKLYNVTILADKFQLKYAISSQASCWMGSIYHDNLSSDALFKLLTAAYLAYLPAYFNKIINQLSFVLPMNSLGELANYPMLPDETKDIIQNKRHSMSTAIRDQVDKAIVQLSSTFKENAGDCDRCSYRYTSTPSHCITTTHMRDFIKTLIDTKLWPWADHNVRSVREVKAQFRLKLSSFTHSPCPIPDDCDLIKTCHKLNKDVENILPCWYTSKHSIARFVDIKEGSSWAH